MDPEGLRAPEEAAATGSALSLRDVHLCYGEVVVLRGLTLQVDTGEIVAILGGNGAGKSTTLKAICGLVAPNSGEIRTFGERADGLPSHKVAARGVALSLQGRQVFPKMSVLENLRLGAYMRRDGARVRQDFDWVLDLFPRLRERQRQAAGTLSGGEQQMLAVGRALMGRPRLLLLDEPSLGVAPKTVAEIADVVREINETGTTVVIVEQNVDLALSLASRGYVLETGRVAVAGSTEFLRGADRVKAAYLGG